MHCLEEDSSKIYEGPRIHHQINWTVLIEYSVIGIIV